MSFVDSLIHSPVRSVRSGAAATRDRVFYDGIHLDFAANLHYRKVAGAAPIVTPFTTLFTFTGGNQSMYMSGTGLLVAAATNTPRIEYGLDGKCLGLLMEATKTNLIQQSATFEHASWTKAQVTISDNAGVSPTGATNADKLVEDTSNNGHFIQNTSSAFVSGGVYTMSVFVKAAGRSIVYISVGAAAFTSATGAWFNLTTGAVGTTSNSPTSTTIRAVGNDWWRISFTKTATASINAGFNIYTSNADGVTTYTGDGSSGLLIWGAQVELGAYASSYIPTTTASVARSADTAIRTLSTEWSAGSGTLFVQGMASPAQNNAVQRFACLHDGTENERTHIARPANSDVCRVSIQDGGINQATLDPGSFTNRARFKAACVWATNDTAATFNGGAIVTDITATLPTITTLEFGLTSLQPSDGWLTRLDYWPERKHNGELIRLTSGGH